VRLLSRSRGPDESASPGGLGVVEADDQGDGACAARGIWHAGGRKRGAWQGRTPGFGRDNPAARPGLVSAGGRASGRP